MLTIWIICLFILKPDGARFGTISAAGFEITVFYILCCAGFNSKSQTCMIKWNSHAVHSRNRNSHHAAGSAPVGPTDWPKWLPLKGNPCHLNCRCVQKYWAREYHWWQVSRCPSITHVDFIWSPHVMYLWWSGMYVNKRGWQGHASQIEFSFTLACNMFAPGWQRDSKWFDFLGESLWYSLYSQK